MFDGQAIAEVVGRGTATNEFLDRWRIPGDDASRVWEERFGEHAYVPLAEIAINDALKSAGVTPSELDHVIVTGLHGRAVKRVAGSIGARTTAEPAARRRFESLASFYRNQFVHDIEAAKRPETRARRIRHGTPPPRRSEPSHFCFPPIPAIERKNLVQLDLVI